MTSVQTLRERLIAHGFKAFPAVDEGDTLLGIVTKPDVLRPSATSSTAWPGRRNWVSSCHSTSGKPG